MKHTRLIVLLVAVCGLFGQDDEKEKKPWTNKTELSAVNTTGNAEVQTLGFGNDYVYTFPKAEFIFKANALRTETTEYTRVARQTADGIQLEEIEDSKTTADNYGLDLKYSREFSQKFYWLSRAKWNRNVPSGVDSRTSLTLGVGNKWVDKDTFKFSSDYGLSYTREEPVVTIPDFEKSYPTLDLGYKLFSQITKSTQFQQDFSAIRNLGEAKDTRLELENALSVSISERLALRVTLDLQHDSEPLFELVPVLDPVGNPTGATVPYELEALDTAFTTSLVINF